MVEHIAEPLARTKRGIDWILADISVVKKAIAKRVIIIRLVSWTIPTTVANSKVCKATLYYELRDNFYYNMTSKPILYLAKQGSFEVIQSSRLQQHQNREYRTSHGLSW